MPGSAAVGVGWARAHCSTARATSSSEATSSTSLESSSSISSWGNRPSAAVSLTEEQAEAEPLGGGAGSPPLGAVVEAREVEAAAAPAVAEEEAEEEGWEASRRLPKDFWRRRRTPVARRSAPRFAAHANASGHSAPRESNVGLSARARQQQRTGSSPWRHAIELERHQHGILCEQLRARASKEGGRVVHVDGVDGGG